VTRYQPLDCHAVRALIVDAPEAVRRHSRFGEVQWVLEYSGTHTRGHVSLLMQNPTREQRVQCRLWCSLVTATLTMVGLDVRRAYTQAFLLMSNM
jgi:hypothetical protein